MSLCPELEDDKYPTNLRKACDLLIENVRNWYAGEKRMFDGGLYDYTDASVSEFLQLYRDGGWYRDCTSIQ